MRWAKVAEAASSPEPLNAITHPGCVGWILRSRRCGFHLLAGGFEVEDAESGIVNKEFKIAHSYAARVLQYPESDARHFHAVSTIGDGGIKVGSFARCFRIPLAARQGCRGSLFWMHGIRSWFGNRIRSHGGLGQVAYFNERRSWNCRGSWKAKGRSFSASYVAHMGLVIRRRYSLGYSGVLSYLISILLRGQIQRWTLPSLMNALASMVFSPRKVTAL